MAVPVDQLDPGREWRISRLRFQGNDLVSGRTLRAEMLTRTRPWYTFWRRRPVFDPVTFAVDLERLRALYRRRGYYLAQITHDIETEPGEDQLRAVVSIEEGPPARVAAVDVAFAGEPPPPEAEA